MRRCRSCWPDMRRPPHLMSWMLWKLMTTPQLWQECREEVLSVCGMSQPSSEQLKELPILDAVINETLRMLPRLYPSSAKKSSHHSLSHLTHPTRHYSPSHYRPVHRSSLASTSFIAQLTTGVAVPTVFDHTRWLQPGKRPYSHELAFLPFSWGDRGCIGSLFARMEAKVMLCRLLQRVRMEFVAGQQLDAEGAPVHSAIVTFRPKHGVVARVSAAPLHGQ